MIGFRGADPGGLIELAHHLQVLGETLETTAAELRAVPIGDAGGSLAGRAPARLEAMADRLRRDARHLGRRAELIRQADLLMRSGVPRAVQIDARLAADYAMVAPLGVDWATAFGRWLVGPAIEELDGLSPSAVAARLENTSQRARERLVAEHPGPVAALDGAPPPMRVAANRVLLAREVHRLEVQAKVLDSALRSPELDVASPTRRHSIEAERRGVLERVARYQTWLRDGRQLLLFDPRGDGRVVEVFGDLAGAEHVAVLVPGIRTDIASFDAADGTGVRGDAMALRDAARRLDPSVATVVWLGYDAPDGLDALLRDAAESAERDLTGFLGGLVADGDRHLTLIGHSYGSVVAGTAATHGIPVDDLVFIGSPGTTLDHARDADLAPGARVWAGLAGWDPVGAGIDPLGRDAVEWSRTMAGRRWWDLVTGDEAAAADLWHGPNPVHRSFGAVEFTTDGAGGHSQYFDRGTASLANLAAIVAARPDRVEVLPSGLPLRAATHGSSEVDGFSPQ